MRLAAALALCFFLVLPAVADSLAEQFLDGLRKRGWNDVALEYLDSAEQDPLAKGEFLQRLDYERAITLAEMAKTSLRESERSSQYDRAIDLLQKYAAAHRDTLLYFDSMSSAAKMLADQARGKLTAAQRLPEDAARQREPLLQESRERFDASTALLEDLLVACQSKLDSLPKGALSHQDPEIPATREKLKMVEAESHFLAANLLFEKAETFSKSSRGYEETLESAASAFSELNSDYKDKLVGYFGKLYEGRCYQALSRWEQALECFAELVDEPISQPDFRRLKARAFRCRAECLLAQGQLEQAIDECNQCLQDARGDESKQPEWLAVAYRLGEALKQQAAKTTGSEANRLETEARQLMREVANEPGEFQSAAKAALASGSPVQASDVAEYKTFAEAYSAGKDALEKMNSTKLAARLAASNNPEAEPDLRRQAEENMTVAQQLLRKAIQLADERTESEDLLSAEYFLCWLYWEEQRYPETAVMGNFIARRYPESSYAASAAKVALAAYEKLYQEARESGDDAYEAEQLASMAEYMSRRWPESPEAAAAVNLLMQIAIKDNRVDEAKKLLERLPADNRASAQLILGGALWSRYLQQIGGSSNISDAAKRQRAEAANLLSEGYEDLKDQRLPTYQDATGILYYVQLLLDQGDANKAVEVLESPQIGPLAVVDGNQIEVPPAFVQLTYRAALQSYLSANPPQRKKVQEMISALEKSAGTGPEAAKMLTDVYLGMGQQLQLQIKELLETGRKGDAEQVATALEDLLEKVSQRGNAQGWKVRSWIANTSLQLGEGLSGGAAQSYFDKAEKVLRAMLKDAASDQAYAPSPLAILAARKQLGDCLCAKQDYASAMEQYGDILQEKPNTLDLQIAIPLMLEQWGKADRKPEKLKEAIKGAQPQADRKNLIWGWSRLASIANQQKRRVEPGSSQAARFEDLFFQARYHVSQSQLYLAMISEGAQKTEYLEAARKNVESMKRLYPELGGAKWERQFNQLLEQIDAEK